MKAFWEDLAAVALCWAAVVAVCGVVVMCAGMVE